MIRFDSTVSEEPLLLEFESIKVTGPPLDEGAFGDDHWRWNIVFAVLAFLFATQPLWLSVIVPQQVAAVNGVIYLALAFCWIAIAYNAWQSIHRLTYFPQPFLGALPVIRKRSFTHIVVVPCDEEPIEVLFDCLGSLLVQDDPLNLCVVVAFESTSTDIARKEQTIHFAFHDKFGHLLITVHRLNPLKELPGRCSNKNFALHEAFRYIRNTGTHQNPQHAVIITSCETESLFHPNYFATLEKVYNAKNPSFQVAPKNVVWQAPIFYNRNMANRYFFNRITCLCRSMFILGALIPFELNPLSIYSYPLELGLDAGFINPRYAADDVLAKVRWMCSVRNTVSVELLPVPCLLSPASGQTMWAEFLAWKRELSLWIVGSCEALHYFMIHWRGRPFFAGFLWVVLFLAFYCLFVCSSGVFAFFAYFAWPWVTYPWIGNSHLTLRLTACGWMFLLVQYVVCAIAFVIDYRAKRLMTVKENVGVFTSLLHWALAPLSLLVYSTIALWIVLSFAVQGKEYPATTNRNCLRLTVDEANSDIHDDSHQSRRYISDSIDEPTVRFQSLDNTTSSLLYRLPDKVCFGEYCVALNSTSTSAVN
jgi:hypothetical protein